MHKPSLISQYWLVLTSGFAIFSMFFGSGNLVFPITLGTLTAHNYPFAVLGLLLSGVFIPALGLIAILLYKGSVQDFFETIGKPFAFIISLVLLSLLGPLGVIPRCITVAFGGIDLILPGQSYLWFSALFCLATYLILLSENAFIDVMGGLLTPLLLGALLIIIFSAFKNYPASSEPFQVVKPLWQGVKQGYQMMDLIASFFFAATIMHHMNKRMPTKVGYHFKFTLSAIAIGGGLLAGVYVLMIHLGALYASELATVAPEQSIALIAQIALGEKGAAVVATTIIMACLTTAVALAKVCVRFVQNRILKNKLHPQITTASILGITFMMSLLKFEGIAKILSPILETLYPGLILLTVLNIVHHFKPLKYKALILYLSFAASGLRYFLVS